MHALKALSGGAVSRQDTLEHIAGDAVLVALDEDQKVAGFAAVDVNTEGGPAAEYFQVAYPSAYFAACAIAKRCQGTGLYDQFNQRRLRLALDNGAQQVYTRTQNPRVEEGIVREFNRAVDEGYMRSFAVGRQALRGFYGAMLTSDIPRANHLSYDDLDYAKGDAYMLQFDIIKE